MTPTVQHALKDNLWRFWVWAIIGQGLAVMVWLSTGFWGFMVIQAVMSWLQLQSVKALHLHNLRTEATVIESIRTEGYNKVRIDLIEFEDEAERTEDNFERYKKMRFAKKLRGIIEDMKGFEK